MRYFDAKDADLEAASPQMVLLDLNLPKRSGAEVLKHLRSSKRCGATLVLIVSSSDAARDRTAVAELGVEGYFRKPSDYMDFVKLV
jgi:two-component system response regulator